MKYKSSDLVRFVADVVFEDGRTATCVTNAMIRGPITLSKVTEVENELKSNSNMPMSACSIVSWKRFEEG